MSFAFYLYDTFLMNLEKYSGSEILTSVEFNKEIMSTIRSLTKLKKQKLIDDEIFSYLIKICITKFAENKFDEMIIPPKIQNKWIIFKGI